MLYCNYMERDRHTVWIDQDMCTGCEPGPDICYVVAPEMFFLHTDGLAYVKEAGSVDGLDESKEPQHQSINAVEVPVSLLPKVKHAAVECPGEIIFIENA